MVSTLGARRQPIRDFVAAHGAPVAIAEFGVYRYEPGSPSDLGDVLGARESTGAILGLVTAVATGCPRAGWCAPVCRILPRIAAGGAS